MDDMKAAAARVLSGNPLLAAVALIGFAVSFQTIARLAVTHHLPGYPVLYPVLIDIGILAMIAESRRAIEQRRADVAPRLLAWALIGLTLYVNAHGSPPGDWLGRALHVVAPALWAALLELSRWRKVARKRAEDRRDGIPLARWLLAPCQTFPLWRRMVLWQVTSYRAALDREQVRRAAIARLRSVHGSRWKSRADSAVVWQLVHGIDVERASEAVSALAPGPPAGEPAARPGGRPEASVQARPGARPQASPEHGPEFALRLTAARSRSMSPAGLAPHVSAMLETYGPVSQARIKRDLHVSTEKAAEALRIARRERTVVPMGTRHKGG